MTAFSNRAIRLAMLDGMKQEDERTAKRLCEQLRDKAAEMHRLRKEMEGISKRLMVCQRQVSAIADAIAIEEMERKAA